MHLVLSRLAHQREDWIQRFGHSARLSGMCSPGFLHTTRGDSSQTYGPCGSYCGDGSSQQAGSQHAQWPDADRRFGSNGHQADPVSEGARRSTDQGDSHHREVEPDDRALPADVVQSIGSTGNNQHGAQRGRELGGPFDCGGAGPSANYGGGTYPDISIVAGHGCGVDSGPNRSGSSQGTSASSPLSMSPAAHDVHNHLQVESNTNMVAFPAEPFAMRADAMNFSGQQCA